MKKFLNCKFIYLPLMLIFSFTFFNCYKMDIENRIPEFQVKKCLEYDSNKSVDNICMALLPIQEEHEVDKYFGHSLYSANILPILVVAENTNKASSFLLPADEPKIYLFRYDEKTIENPTNIPSEAPGTMNAKKSIYEYGNRKWEEEKDANIVRGFLSMGITGIALSNVNIGPSEETLTSAYSITKKSLRKETLSPLETESGFIYVKLPNEIDKNQKLFIAISVMNMNSGQKIIFDFIEDLKNNLGD